ncbi:MAG: CHRD domain-containing protein [Candidatus Eisenbacteria bacterium]
MRFTVTRRLGTRRTLFVLAALLLAATSARADFIHYTATLSGAAESPPNASPGTGWAQVDIDPVAHLMHVRAEFSGLVGTVTASHIHAATTTAFTGTAGVATTTPTFTGFPGGVTAGTYDHTFDMTQAASWNPSYVTAHGGTTAQAELDFFAAIAAGKAYFNVHTSVFGGGEIRGFLVPGLPSPTQSTTWGRVKALFP